MIIKCLLAACGGTYTDPTGELTSPFFPERYPADQDCEYIITQPEGSTIVVTFISFDIAASYGSDCNTDYLEVRNFIFVIILQ